MPGVAASPFLSFFYRFFIVFYHLRMGFKKISSKLKKTTIRQVGAADA